MIRCPSDNSATNCDQSGLAGKLDLNALFRPGPGATCQTILVADLGTQHHLP